MTPGEKMIWAAAFALYIERMRGESLDEGTYSAIWCASRVVDCARIAEGYADEDVGDCEAVRRLKEMLDD